MKLLLSIIATSLACGFFAGLLFSTSWQWAIGVVLAGIVGVQWIRAEIETTQTIKEEDLA
ncbi:MAG: hypothetical protein EOM14_10770 [Clostridia bacterium]|nr:hypothetical protein [Clostridia bacterium]